MLSKSLFSKYIKIMVSTKPYLKLDENGLKLWYEELKDLTDDGYEFAMKYHIGHNVDFGFKKVHQSAKIWQSQNATHRKAKAQLMPNPIRMPNYVRDAYKSGFKKKELSE